MTKETDKRVEVSKLREFFRSEGMQTFIKECKVEVKKKQDTMKIVDTSQELEYSVAWWLHWLISMNKRVIGLDTNSTSISRQFKEDIQEFRKKINNELGIDLAKYTKNDILKMQINWFNGIVDGSVREYSEEDIVGKDMETDPIKVSPY